MRDYLLTDFVPRLAHEADGQQSLPFRLTGSQAKTAFAIRANCEKMLRGNARGTVKVTRYFDEKSGEVKEASQYVATNPEYLNCAAFLTLTVGDTDENGDFQQVFDAAEASRRINNVRPLLMTIFERAILVSERHKNKAVHFHLIGVLRSHTDIRTGFDFQAFHTALNARSKGSANRGAEIRYAISANDELRRLWELLRAKLPGFGFGRAQLTPIEKTGEAVACYVSKYIEKNICNRIADDKRKKLVRYLGWEKTQLKPNEFEWNGKRAVAWRGKSRECLSLIGCDLPDKKIEPAAHVVEACTWTMGKIRPKQLDGSAANKLIGPRWAFAVHNIWTKIDDTAVAYMVWDFQIRELVRGEMVRLIGLHTAKKRDANRAEFAEVHRDSTGETSTCLWRKEAWN